MSDSEKNSATKSGAASNRLPWLDAVRGVAVLGMLETHAVNAFLSPDFAGGSAFGWLRFFNGLIAPAFLWIAGYAHGLGMWKRLAKDPPVPASARTWRRLAVVLAIGYFLHAPWTLTEAAWREFWAVDVLQCLAAALMALLLMEKLGRRVLTWALPAIATLPVLAGLAPRPLAVGFWPLDAWFDTAGTALFPLVPWAGFVWIGAAMSRWRADVRVWALVGAVLTQTPQPDVFAKAHPCFFLERFGWLLLVVSVVAWAFSRWKVPAWLSLAGRESLVVYVGHLVLLYFTPLAAKIGPTQPPWVVAGIALGLVAVSMTAAWASDRWKKHRATRE